MDYVDQIKQFKKPQRMLNTLSTEELRKLIAFLDRPMWEQIIADVDLIVLSHKRRQQILKGFTTISESKIQHHDYDEFQQWVKRFNIPDFILGKDMSYEATIIGAIQGDFAWLDPAGSQTLPYLVNGQTYQKWMSSPVQLMDCFHHYDLPKMTIEEILTANNIGIKVAPPKY